MDKRHFDVLNNIYNGSILSILILNLFNIKNIYILPVNPFCSSFLDIT